MLNNSVVKGMLSYANWDICREGGGGGGGFEC